MLDFPLDLELDEVSSKVISGLIEIHYSHTIGTRYSYSLIIKPGKLPTHSQGGVIKSELFDRLVNAMAAAYLKVNSLVYLTNGHTNHDL